MARPPAVWAPRGSNGHAGWTAERPRLPVESGPSETNLPGSDRRTVAQEVCLNTFLTSAGQKARLSGRKVLSGSSQMRFLIIAILAIVLTAHIGPVIISSAQAGNA